MSVRRSGREERSKVVARGHVEADARVRHNSLVCPSGSSRRCRICTLGGGGQDFNVHLWEVQWGPRGVSCVKVFPSKELGRAASEG